MKASSTVSTVQMVQKLTQKIKPEILQSINSFEEEYPATAYNIYKELNECETLNELTYECLDDIKRLHFLRTDEIINLNNIHINMLKP